MDLSRKLPVGVQDFEKLREEGYIYVDKSEYVYNLTHSGSSYFLARPRCFGKTLLLSTLESYFKGRKDLFEGLKIESLEEEWQDYPIFHIDFSTDVYSTEGNLDVSLNTFLTEQEQRYGKHEERTTYAKRFEHVIHRAYETSGKPVVVLIDDYDKPILDAMFSPVENENREILRNFLSALNGNDYYLKFVFVTGITKFASVNIFNGSNQLKDISLYSEFENICGFSADEIKNNFVQELDSLAEKQGIPQDRIFEDFSQKYLGYSFSRNLTKVFNPFSALNALDSGELSSFWFQRGLPSMLIKMLQKSKYDIFALLEGLCVDGDGLMDYKWTEEDLTTVILQSGYLTIRDYDANRNLFELAFPNKEVEVGFLKCLLPFYTNCGSTSKLGSELAALKADLARGDTQAFVNRFSAAVKGLPLLQKSKEEAESVYLLALHTLLRLTGFKIISGAELGGSRNDIAIQAGSNSYIFVLKMDKGIPLEDILADAFARIEEKSFESKIEEKESEIHKVALVFSSSKPELSGWKEIF